MAIGIRLLPACDHRPCEQAGQQHGPLVQPPQAVLLPVRHHPGCVGRRRHVLRVCQAHAEALAAPLTAHPLRQ